MDKEGQVYNKFVDLVSVVDGKADTIVSAVKTVLLKKGIQTEKLYGLGTFFFPHQRAGNCDN